MFAHLTKKLEGLAVEAETPPCNPLESAQAVSTTVRSFPLPSVSCKVPQLVKPLSAYSGSQSKVTKLLELGVNSDTPCPEVCRM